MGRFVPLWGRFWGDLYRYGGVFGAICTVMRGVLYRGKVVFLLFAKNILGETLDFSLLQRRPTAPLIF